MANPYRVAIFERDSRVIEKGLSDAEDAIVWRTRELYQENGAAVETERGALDDAKYALEALRVALKRTHVRPKILAERGKIGVAVVT